MGGGLPVTETITLTEEEGKRMVLLETDYTVSSEELLRQAGFLVEQIEKREAETKGTTTAKRIPMLTDSLVGMQTKSAEGFGEGDGKVYIVSLGDGLGFGLFAGDKRGGGLIGYAEEGDFDPDAAPAEAQFLFQALTDYVSNTIEQTEAMRGDSIYETLVAKFGFVGEQGVTKGDFDPSGDLILSDSSVYVNLGRTTEITTTGVLMTAKWGQRWPYNMKIEQVHQQDYPAGCVATAVAQIMNYHKHGSYFVRYLWEQFPDRYWPASTNPATQSVAQLFYDLGNSHNLKMQYGLNGSGASSSDVPHVLNQYGFYHNGVQGYNFGSICNSITNRYPVYMRGQPGKNQDGHAWVLDGLKTEEINREIWRMDYYYQGVIVHTNHTHVIGNTYTRYHHNWGWGGQYDCWLNEGIYTLAGVNYNDGNQIIVNIRPIN